MVLMEMVVLASFRKQAAFASMFKELGMGETQRKH